MTNLLRAVAWLVIGGTLLLVVLVAELVVGVWRGGRR